MHRRGGDYGLKFHSIDLSRNADCIVRIDQDEFHCHLLVLQSYSTFFDERNCKEIDLTGVSYRNFSFIPREEGCNALLLSLPSVGNRGHPCINRVEGTKSRCLLV